MSEIVWTAREALACALCWAEFSSPENIGVASPEAYWLSLPSQARDLYRSEANKKWLLAVVRGLVEALEKSADALDEVSRQCVKHGINGIGNIGNPAREAARAALEAAPIPSQYHGVRGFDADGFLDAYAVWNGKRRVVIARATGPTP